MVGGQDSGTADPHRGAKALAAGGGVQQRSDFFEPTLDTGPVPPLWRDLRNVVGEFSANGFASFNRDVVFVERLDSLFQG